MITETRHSILSAYIAAALFDRLQARALGYVLVEFGPEMLNEIVSDVVEILAERDDD